MKSSANTIFLISRLNSSVFVHCQYGADRTGAAVAVYRVVVLGWTKDDAIAEMDKFGFHSIWSVLKKYVRNLDVPRLKAKIDAAPPPKVELVN